MKLATKTTRFIQILAVPIGLAMIIMSFITNDASETMTQKKALKYDGTYSLYVGNTDHFSFKWITETEDIGVYEVLNKNKQVIASGETSASRTHHVDLDKKVKAPFTLKFGGRNQGMHQVKIRNGFTLEKTDYKKVDSVYVVGDVHGDRMSVV